MGLKSWKSNWIQSPQLAPISKKMGQIKIRSECSQFLLLDPDFASWGHTYSLHSWEVGISFYRWRNWGTTVELLAQNHAASQWQSKGQNPPAPTFSPQLTYTWFAKTGIHKSMQQHTAVLLSLHFSISSEVIMRNSVVASLHISVDPWFPAERIF